MSQDPRLVFGTRGIWHKPASERTKKQDVPAIVLEQLPEGGIYIFTLKPHLRGYKNIHGRIATIFPSDFTPDA